MAHSSEHDGTKALPDVHDTCKDTPHTMHDLSMLKHAHYADSDTEFDQKCTAAARTARLRLTAHAWLSRPGWEYALSSMIHESD